MGLVVRRQTGADEDAVVSLLAETGRQSLEVATRTFNFLQSVALAELVAEVDGVIVGRASVARTPMMQAGTVALNVGVTAAARRRGVGAALFDRTAENVPDGTGRLLAFTDDRDDDVVMGWLEARHFRPFQHSIHSRLDLRSRPAVPDKTDRSDLTVELVDPYSTADDPGVIRLYEDSDTSPEAQAIGALTWQQQLDGARVFRTEALLLLVRDSEGQPVAMSMAQHAEGRRWNVHYTGVLPQARGRALGRFAKAALHDALAERGVEEIGTDNEASNTGIRHVNDQLGYRRDKGMRRHTRDLTADPLP